MAAPITTAFRHGPHVELPAELVDSLNQVYFLHQLATEPEKVIPPGKTLLSMVVHSQMNSEKTKQDQEQPLLERVKEVAHRAFWTEAIESLSSPLPSVQLPRLKRLYLDLADALAPLLPPDHRVMQSLRAHLPPTSSPLNSALNFLKEVLQALRKRCAPIRDEALDYLYSKLDDWRDPRELNPLQTDLEPSSSPFAVLIVGSIKEIVSLAEYMKSDLNTVLIGSMSEQDVKRFVLQEAKDRERELVLELWNSSQEPGEERLREEWQSWLALDSRPLEASFGAVVPEKKWIVRLMSQLATNLQITSNFPSSLLKVDPPIAPSQPDTSNELPPQFFLVAPKLFYIQNYLQAITIAASLRSLTRLPPASSLSGSRNSNSPGNDFMDRIWSMLKLEIDEDANGTASSGSGSTKIINLSDEVIRARRLVSAAEIIDVEEESRLRDAVERTLRPQDPVFLLLHRRLTDALTKHLLDNLGVNESNTQGRIPETMRTGRTIGPRTHTNIVYPDLLGSSRLETAPPVNIKGFEDPTLVDAIYSAYREILASVTWVELVWGELVWYVP